MSECPVCKKEALRGKPQLVDEWTEALPLVRIDEEDGYHFHDHSLECQLLQCSNGHEWIESTKKGCRHCSTLDCTTVIITEESR